MKLLVLVTFLKLTQANIKIKHFTHKKNLLAVYFLLKPVCIRFLKIIDVQNQLPITLGTAFMFLRN